MFPGTGFPFQQYREQLSREAQDRDNDLHNAYLPPIPQEPDLKVGRAPYRPTNREYAVYVASFVAGILLTHMAHNDNVEEVLGHINSQVLNVLGGSVAATSLLRWMLHECGFINKTKSK